MIKALPTRCSVALLPVDVTMVVAVTVHGLHAELVSQLLRRQSILGRLRIDGGSHSPRDVFLAVLARAVCSEDRLVEDSNVPRVGGRCCCRGCQMNWKLTVLMPLETENVERSGIDVACGIVTAIP